MRVHRIAIAVMALLVACGSSKPRPAPPPDPEADRAAIKQVFQAYVTKSTSGDTRGAVALLDGETMAFYDDLRGHALRLSGAALKARPLDEQILIIMFRAGKTAAYLRDTKIEQLVADALTPLVDLSQLRIGPIELRGDRASASIGVGDFAIAIKFDFHREPAGWRLNMLEPIKLAAKQISSGDSPEQTITWLAGYYKLDVDALYAAPE